MAEWFHLFPFRTQKLSTPAPNVLNWKRFGSLGRRRFVHSSVAQSVEHLTVNQGVTGSSPVRGAIFKNLIGISWGIAKSVKARDFDSRTVGSSPAAPAIDSLAQSVEHLTFNQRVPGSSPGWITITRLTSSTGRATDS